MDNFSDPEAYFVKYGTVELKSSLPLILAIERQIDCLAVACFWNCLYLKAAPDSLGSNRKCHFFVKTCRLWHNHLEKEKNIRRGLQCSIFQKHGYPAANQIERRPSDWCRGNLISTPDSGYYRVFYKTVAVGKLTFWRVFWKNQAFKLCFGAKKMRSR